MKKDQTVLLDISHITKRFGGLVACMDLNLNAYQGEILGIIGPNGAGKSTILNMICGTITPTEGQITFNGEKITKLPPHMISMKGISRVFQGNLLFRNLSVVKNVLIGIHMRTLRGFLGSIAGTLYSHNMEKLMDEKAMEILESVGLARQADRLAVHLSHGDQRLLCLAVALASDPKLLLLDEPVTGMNLEEVSAMISLVKMLREKKGITVITVEHNIRAIMSLCDRIAVISYGSKIAEGLPEEIKTDQSVIEAYLGAEQDVVYD